MLDVEQVGTSLIDGQSTGQGGASMSVREGSLEGRDRDLLQLFKAIISF